MTATCRNKRACASVPANESHESFCFRGHQLPSGEGRMYLRNYVETAAVDPYMHGAHVEVLQGSGGEVYQLRRLGPARGQLEIAVSCWSDRRRPEWCCPAGCWTAQSLRDHCCEKGVSADGGLLHGVSSNLTPHLMPQELERFDTLSLDRFRPFLPPACLPCHMSHPTTTLGPSSKSLSPWAPYYLHVGSYTLIPFNLEALTHRP